MKLKALDLFCGGGGVAEGLIDAGFDVFGVDIEDHPNYPGYPDSFLRADVCQMAPDFLDGFDLVWASPPCQKFSSMTRSEYREKHQDLIDPTRRLIDRHPFTVIENVPGAPIRADLKLTGPMVGLPRIRRLRVFELSWFFMAPPVEYPNGKALGPLFATITTSMCSSNHYYKRKAAGMRGRIPKAEALEIMGIRHNMTIVEIGEAIPPRYAEYIGRQARQAILRDR